MAHSARRGRAASWAATFARIPALSLAAVVWANGSVVQAEARQAPNSRIALEVPESFIPSDRFSGFVDENSGASFLIIEMPDLAYDEVKTIADRPEALAQRGVVDTRKADLPERSGEYVYLAGRQKTLAGDFAKHILIMRESGITAMITANIPQRALDSQAVTPQQVERAFVTASVKAEMVRGEQLFSLGYLGPFKETMSFAGSTKAYNLTGQVPEPGQASENRDPIFIVAPSVDKTPLADVKLAAQNSFRAIGALAEHKVQSEQEVTIGGLKGYEVIGQGKDAKQGQQTGVYMVLLAAEKGGYYLLAGTARAADMQKYLPEFQRIATSFQPNQTK